MTEDLHGEGELTVEDNSNHRLGMVMDAETWDFGILTPVNLLFTKVNLK